MTTFSKRRISLYWTMDHVVTWPWLFQTRKFWRFGSAAIPYIVHSTIGLLGVATLLVIFLSRFYVFCQLFTVLTSVL